MSRTNISQLWSEKEFVANNRISMRSEPETYSGVERQAQRDPYDGQRLSRPPQERSLFQGAAFKVPSHSELRTYSLKSQDLAGETKLRITLASATL